IPPAEDSSIAVMNELVEKITSELDAIDVAIYLVEQPRYARILGSRDLLRRHLLHAKILEDVVYPYVEEQEAQGSNPPDILLSPDLLAKRHAGRVRVERVNDLNSAEFLQHLVENPQIKL